MFTIKDFFNQYFIDGIDQISANTYCINNENINTVLEEYYNKTENLIKNLEQIKYEITEVLKFHPDETIVLLEYAGIGDAFHTKLVIQHIENKYKNIVWITNNIIKDLFKNHKNLTIFDNKIDNKIRYPEVLLTPTYLSFIDKCFRAIFNEFDNKLDISYNITISHRLCSQKKEQKTFDQHYYDIFGIQRDFSIKHNILHEDKIEINNEKPIIAFEHCSRSFRHLTNIEAYSKIVDLLNFKYNIYLLGSIDDPYIKNTIDFRGKSLYDCISIIKKADIFIGRNSANQLLTVFKPNIDIIELDTTNNIFQSCRYVDKPILSISTRNNIDYINMIKERIKND